MKFLKFVSGFVVGALGAAAAIFVSGCYVTGSTGLMFVMFGSPIAAVVGGIVGGACAMLVHWSKPRFLRLGAFTLLGVLLIGALWIFIPNADIDPAVLAVWLTPTRILQQAPFGLVFGTAIGAFVGLIATALTRNNLPPLRPHISTEMEEGVWPPAPTQEIS